MSSTANYIVTNGIRIDLNQLIGMGGTAKVYGTGDSDSSIVAKISYHTSGSRVNAEIRRGALINEANLLRLLQGVPHVIRMHRDFNFNPFGEKLDRHVVLLDRITHTQEPNQATATLYYSLVQQGIRAFDWHQMTSCMKQLLEVLSQLKKRGILHRDISPNNLVFNYHSNLLTLFDFGNGSLIKDHINSNDQTTLHYRAPESFFRKKETDYGMDMWSLGVILFMMYTGGQIPFSYPKNKDIPSSLIKSLGSSMVALLEHLDKDADSELPFSIVTNLGVPSESYVKSCAYTKDGLVKLVDEHFKRDWKELIWKAQKRRGDSEHRAKLMIDFLGRIFCYENRLSCEEALNHPLFADDMHIELDCEKLSEKQRKELFLRLDDYEIPLTSTCIHVPSKDRYEILIETAEKCVCAFREAKLVKGAKMTVFPKGNLFAIWIQPPLNGKSLFFTEEKSNDPKPCKKNSDGSVACDMEEVVAS